MSNAYDTFSKKQHLIRIFAIFRRKLPLAAAEAVLTYWFFCCIIEPAGSNSGRARLHSELERELFLFQVLWLHLSSKERWTAVASLPKGGDGYEEVHRICFSFPFAFDSIYYKSKLAAHVSKYGG